MVSSGDDQEKAVPLCLNRITSTTFYRPCKTHDSEEHNYCIVCKVALCDKCKMEHVPSEMQHVPSEHKMIRAYKVHEVTSFRMEDLKSLWDMSDICPYASNGYLVAYIRKRGDRIARFHGQSGLAKCESCPYRFKSPGAKYCSVECKVEAVTKMNGSESTKNEAKTKVETISMGSSSNVKSFRKRPRKQKNSQRAPLY